MYRIKYILERILRKINFVMKNKTVDRMCECYFFIIAFKIFLDTFLCLKHFNVKNNVRSKYVLNQHIIFTSLYYEYSVLNIIWIDFTINKLIYEINIHKNVDKIASKSRISLESFDFFFSFHYIEKKKKLSINYTILRTEKKIME